MNTVMTRAIGSLTLLAGAAHAQVERIIRPTVTPTVEAAGVAELRDGYATIGTALNANGQEVAVLTRHTLGGAVVWQRFLMDPRQSRGYCIIATRDGGIAVAGETSALSPTQAYTTIVKTDGLGNILWARAIPGTTYADTPISVGLREARDGNLILVGRTLNPGAPTQFGAAALFTPVGGIIWSALYRDPRSNVPITRFEDVRETVDPGGNRIFCIVGATALDPAARPHAFATLLRPADGASVLAREYAFLGNTEATHANGLLPLNSQQIRFTGRITDPQNGLADDTVVWDVTPALVPLTPAAIYRNFRVAHNAIEPSQTAVGVTTLAGALSNAAGGPDDAALLTLSATPSFFVWANRYGGQAVDAFRGLFTRPDSIIAVGMTNSFAGPTWIYTARTDPFGRDTCETSLQLDPRPTPPREVAFEFPRLTLPVLPYPVSAPPQAVFQRIVCNRCPADFNEDGFLDFFDYDDYVNCYENGICPPGKDADFNNDGFVDFFDYDDFVAAFERGC